MTLHFGVKLCDAFCPIIEIEFVGNEKVLSMKNKNQTMNPAPLHTVKDLNDIFDLFPRKGLVVLVGSPGSGKSIFALNLIESALLNNPSTAALIFSLGRSSKEVLDLMAHSMSEITAWKFDPENLSGREAARFKKARKSIEKLPLLIRDGARSVKDICATAHTINDIILKQNDKMHFGAILVDYVEGIEPSDKSKGRTFQIGECIMRLKILSEELEVPIILLAGLNRKNFYEPKVDNLMWAEEIKKYADTIALLSYREIPIPTASRKKIRHKIRLNIVNLSENSCTSIPLIFKRSSLRYIPEYGSLD